MFCVYMLSVLRGLGMRYNIKSNNVLNKRIGFILLLLSFLMIIYMFISSIPYQKKKFEINFNHDFSKSWVLIDDNLDVNEKINLPYINKNSNKITITKKIPDKYLSNPTILLGASQQKVKVYLEGINIHTFEPLKSKYYNKITGTSWIIVELPKNCFGKEITIEYESSFKNSSGLISEIFYGNRNDNLLALIVFGINKIIIAIIFIVIGVIVFIFAMRLKRLNIEVSKGLFYLTAGILSMSVWIIIKSECIVLINNNFVFNYYIEFICLYSIPVFYFLFLYKMCHIKNREKIGIIARIHFLLLFSLLLGQFLEIIDFYSVQGTFFYILIINLIISTIIMVRELDRKNYLRIYIVSNVIMIILTLSEFGVFKMYLVGKGKIIITLCAIALAINLIYKFYSSYFEIYYSKIENAYLQKLIESQIDHYRNIDKSYSIIKKYKHDMKNHLLCLNHLLSSGEIEKAKSYLEKISEGILKGEEIFDTGNYILDAIITEKSIAARSKGIIFNSNIMINKNIKIDPVDWCIIFGNALDNAIEACEKIEDNRKFISLKLMSRSNTFIVKIINSSKDDFIVEKKRYLTTKKNKDEHGIGMNSIKNAIEKYDGILNIRYEKNLFEVSIVFYDV